METTLMESRFFVKTDPRHSKLHVADGDGAGQGDQTSGTQWSQPYEFDWAKSFCDVDDVVLVAGSGPEDLFKFYLTDVCQTVHACCPSDHEPTKEDMVRAIGEAYGPQAAAEFPDRYFNRLRYVNASTAELPYEDEQFDKVFCLCVLENLSQNDMLKSFEEFQRVLKPSGVLVLTIKSPASELSVLRVIADEYGFKFAGPVALERPDDAVTCQNNELACFRAVLRKATKLPPVLALALEHYESGNLDKAIEICTQVMEQSPDLAEARYLTGIIHHQRGDHATAAELVSVAIQTNDSDPTWHVNMAIILAALNRFEDSVPYYQRAIELNPDLMEAYCNLSNIMWRLGRDDEAVDYAREAVRIDPKSVAALSNLTQALKTVGELEESLDVASDALKLSPNHPDLLNHQGTLYSDLGDKVKAINCFRKSLLQDPENPYTFNYLGEALLDANELEDAVFCLEQAVAVVPDFDEARRTLAKAQARLAAESA